MKFLKMHGLGNDFVILDQRDGAQKPAPDTVRDICDRHTGVGCDQLIIMEPSKRADLFMRIYNSDGSEAESCGNATRCVAHLYMKEAGTQACSIETIGGLLPCRLLAGDLVEVDMGAPLAIADLDIDAGKVKPVSVTMGNPHCVFFVDNLVDISVETIGPVYEVHELFPKKTNVEFAQIQPDGSIRLRVWERGAGITLACGSGACATMVAAVHRGLSLRKTDIIMDGGRLTLEYRENDNHVLMTGPVAYVFDGKLL
jgi:diaminopimelate epimerase